MSLGSHYPELLDQAFRDTLVSKIVSGSLKSWHGKEKEEKLREQVTQELDELCAGCSPIWDFLCNLDGVGSDALDRFHEHFR